MFFNWIFVALGLAMWFTKARWLGFPYFAIYVIYIVNYYLVVNEVVYNTSIPLVVLGEYLHWKFYAKLDDPFSKVLRIPILIGMITYVALGVELYLNYTFVYEFYKPLVYYLNWIQLLLLGSGGACGLVYKDMFHFSPGVHNTRSLFRLFGKEAKQ